MNFKLLFSAIILLTFFYSQAQEKKDKKGIVDDSTKVLYGTLTTKIFTQETLLSGKQIYFQKDTLFVSPFESASFLLDAQFERPKLYTQQELKLKAKLDSLKSLKADSLKKSKLTLNDTVTYFSKDTTEKKNKKNFLSSIKRPYDPERDYKSRFYKNEYIYSRPDTSLDKLQQYNMNYIDNNIYQNLGVVGTPTKAVFPLIPSKIGYHSGLNVFDKYYTEPDKVKYYNSLSPYTNFYYLGFPGTNGEDRAKLDLNRNITRNWNLGLSYERINVDKQIGITSNSAKSLALGQEFIVYTSTKSKNGRYHLMANANYFLYYINEQGGLSTDNPENVGVEGTTLPQNEAPQDVRGWPVNLNALRFGLNPSDVRGKIFSRDRRVSYHLYHQFDILRLGRLSIFHEFDRRNQKYAFRDNISPSEVFSTYYKSNAKSADSINYRREFAYINNRVGIKSQFGNFSWNGFLRYRNVQSADEMAKPKGDKFFSTPSTEINKFLGINPLSTLVLDEYYIGGGANYRKGDSINIEFKAELLSFMNNRSSTLPVFEDSLIIGLGSASQDTILVVENSPFRNYNYKGDYQISTRFQFFNWEFGGASVKSSPAITDLYSYRHSAYYWNNNFDATFTQQLYFKYHYKFKDLYLSVSPSFVSIKNHIYYNPSFQPTQEKQNLNFGFLDLQLNTNLWWVHFDNYFKYTFIPSNQPDVIRMPELYFNPRIYLKYVPKKKVNRQDFRFGFDIYYRSAYFGDGYMPSISRFYIQNDFMLNNNILLDFFVTAKMRNARIFLKINQLNQMLGFTNGYYITPYYPGTLGSFVMGVHWLLFD